MGRDCSLVLTILKGLKEEAELRVVAYCSSVVKRGS